MIEIKNISKEFTKIDKNKKKIKFLADNDINFEVKEGEIVGLLGPNGAGKTTLLRIIAGIMKSTKGEIIIDDMTYNKNEIDIKRIITFLSGNTKLYKDFSPIELMKLCSEFYGMDEKKANDKIEELIKQFDMEQFKNQKIGSLSTGQYQRASIARCCVHDPKYYIMDEATSGLDVISSKTIIDFILKEKKNKKGIIYSTHYMEEAENICDRVVLINKGKIIASGTPKQIEKDTKTTNIRDAFFALIEGDENEN